MRAGAEPRRIAVRHHGSRHGPITRLISPQDLGQSIKPFVFLDYVNADKGPGFGFHPHSGIATLTHPLSFDIEHETSSGQIDVVAAGGVEWVIAGGGLWHRAGVVRGAPVQGFQLWLALPPSQENAPSSAQFIDPASVPEDGPIRILLGAYGQARSPIDAPFDANCFILTLRQGQSWTYTPPPTHQIAWAFAQSGDIDVNGERLGQDLAVFEDGCGDLDFRAISDGLVLVASAARHPYPLVLGSHSVHTSPQALSLGQQRINDIGAQLRQAGRLY
jgi:redox-sensitive bicupin YhaK (pirin superfamily)